MYSNLKTTSALMSVIILSACASVPNGPSSMALPGTGKNFEEFRIDDASCRQFAQDQVGGATANQASNDSFVKSAVVGTALGAAVGSATGGGRSTGSGAAMGLLVGSLIGVNEANASASGTQRRYDHAYTQCMYAKGHHVQVSGRIITQQPLEYMPVPQAVPNGYPAPPPPPGYVPPIPPDFPK